MKKCEDDEYQIFYKKGYSTLLDLTKARAESDILYSENELWYIMQFLTNFVATLKNFSLYYTDITPENLELFKLK